MEIIQLLQTVTWQLRTTCWWGHAWRRATHSLLDPHAQAQDKAATVEHVEDMQQVRTRTLREERGGAARVHWALARSGGCVRAWAGARSRSLVLLRSRSLALSRSRALARAGGSTAVSGSHAKNETAA